MPQESDDNALSQQAETLEQQKCLLEGAGTADVSRSARLKSWGFYLAKAACILGIIFLFGLVAPGAPAWVVAVVWAALSAISAFGITYHTVVLKTYGQNRYEQSGHLGKFTWGRVICLIVSFCVSAWCMAGLLLAVPTWSWQIWCLMGIAALLQPPVSLGVGKLLRKECKPLYRRSKNVLISAVIIGALLCAGYFALLSLQPSAEFANLTEAYLATEQPFASSPSALMVEGGMFTAYADALMAYAASQAVGISAFAGNGLLLVFTASTFFGIASLLSLCTLKWRDLKRVFLPLHEDEGELQASRMLKGPAITLAVLVICLVGAFLLADHQVTRLMETDEYTTAEKYIQRRASIVACVIDGTYYEQQATQELLAQVSEESVQLASDAAETLAPLINAYYDAQLENVDGYLDWYYSLTADYTRLAKLVTGSVEDYVAEQLTTTLTEGVDDSALTEQLEAFTLQAAELEENFEAQLAEYQLTGIPDWLLTTGEALDSNALSGATEPSRQVLTFGQRLGIDVTAGVATGVASKTATKALGKQLSEKMAKKATEKTFFKVIVKKITGTLASKGVGAAAGAAVGSVVPGAGTAIGAVVGTGAGVAMDYGLLKIDEWQNRDTYREEIVQMIEDERTEALAGVGASAENGEQAEDEQEQ